MHSKKKKASHTDKRTHRTPPEHLAVSVVRRHENPPLRPLFEPTLQLHFLSSNLPNTLCSFCSLFKCLLQTEMHNIRHNTSSPPSIPPSPHPHCHCLTKCRVYPWLSLSKSTGALWKLFCRLRSWGSILWALQSHSFLRQHCGLQYVAADSLHRTHAHYMLSCRFRVFEHMSGTVPKECKDMECHRCT